MGLENKRAREGAKQREFMEASKKVFMKVGGDNY